MACKYLFLLNFFDNNRYNGTLFKVFAGENSWQFSSIFHKSINPGKELIETQFFQGHND